MLGEQGHRPLAGEVILAPGEHHMSVDSSKRIKLTEDSPVRGHRPSATHLFRSVASVYGAQGLGVILTGMGDDGADGLVELRRAGGWVMDQDEATSVVYGMPREAAARGGVSEVLPLPGDRRSDRRRLEPRPPRSGRLEHTSTPLNTARRQSDYSACSTAVRATRSCPGTNNQRHQGDDRCPFVFRTTSRRSTRTVS